MDNLFFVGFIAFVCLIAITNMFLPNANFLLTEQEPRVVVEQNYLSSPFQAQPREPIQQSLKVIEVEAW